MAARKSTNWASVAPRTPTGPGACHSFKAAESLARGAHSLQPLSGLLGASRGLSAIIRVPYGSGKNRSRAHSLSHKLARNSGLQLAQNSKLQLAAHGNRHKLARKGKDEELARKGKDKELAREGKPHKLARESKGEKLAREGKPHKLRHTVGVTNCAGKLATFKGQKCNDQNILWRTILYINSAYVTKCYENRQ